MNRRFFTINFLVFPVVLVMLIFLTSLGFWQLHRAQEKRQILAEYKTHSEGVSLSAKEALEQDTDSLRYSPIELTGHYDNGHSILLDNRPFEGHVGYEILTPFWIEGIDTAVMVNRGWIPRGRDRNILPAVPDIEGKQILQGTILVPSSKVFRLGPEEEQTGWPWRLQHFDAEAITARLKYSIAPFVVALESDKIQPVYMSPERHLGYAVQWFALAITLLVCFSIFKLKSRLD